MESKDQPQKLGGRRRSTNEEVNDALTIEQMLQVKDNRTGKKADVRVMLGVNNQDIKDQKLKDQMSNYSLADSQKIAGGSGTDSQNSLNMGSYLKGLDFVDFDTGKFEDDPMDESLSRKVQAQHANWNDWWQIKKKLNDKLKVAIQNNDSKEALMLINDPDETKRADVNQKFMYDDMMLSPLLFAIRCFKNDQSDTSIMKALLQSYADINHAEEKTGFTCLIMSCHLVNESDALKIIQLLCEHKNYPGQPRLVNIDAQDIAQNTTLHHAALTNKLQVCKYLIEQGANTQLLNKDESPAIDLATSEEVISFLATYQTLSKNKNKKSKKVIDRLSSAFKKGPKNGEQAFDFDQKYADHQNQSQADIDPRSSARKTLRVANAGQTMAHKIGLADFKVIDRVGSGAFGSVFLVCPKKYAKNPTQGPLFAMKILEKENVLKQNLARYALTEKSVLSVAGNHRMIVNLDFAFQNEHRLYLIMEFCPGGDLGTQIKNRNKMRNRYTEQEARAYICEIILGLEFLHKNDIIFRDLKPENVVLTATGHVKLTDFGLSKQSVDESVGSKSFVGSIAYLAPEILKKQNHYKSLDWYLTGLLLYEMIVGQPPYYKNNRKELFENIMNGPLRIPQSMSLEARDLILNLLNRNPKKRLGAGPEDANELKRHAFFKDIDWEAVEQGKLQMPPIDARKDFKVNPQAEMIFNEGEKVSKENMNKVYQLLKAGERVNEKGSSSKEKENVEFLADPKEMPNWSVIGEDALDKLN